MMNIDLTNKQELMARAFDDNYIELVFAVKEYREALEIEQTVKALVKELANKVLTENCYMMSAEKVAELNAAASGREFEVERITEEFDTCMMGAEDFQDYLEKLYAEEEKCGIANPKGKGWCADAEPRENRFAAEKKMLTLFEKVAGAVIPHKEYQMCCKHWKFKQNLIDLCLNMVDEYAEKEV